MTETDERRTLRVIEEREGEQAQQLEESIEECIEEASRCLVDGNQTRAVWCALRANFYIAQALSSPKMHPAKFENELYPDSDFPHRLYRGFKEGYEEIFGFDALLHNFYPITVLENHEVRSELVLAAMKNVHPIGRTRIREKGLQDFLDYLDAAAQANGLIEEPGEDTYVVGEDFEESWLHELYETRREQSRALSVVIVARDNATGTGKTTLAVQLAQKWADGWSAEECATNRAWEYREMIRNSPQGSILLADEIGQMFDSRRSMTKENVQVSQDYQMMRFRELITIATLPGTSFLDKRLRQLADVLILSTRRGGARVYELKTDDASGEPFRTHRCNVEWGPMDGDSDYEYIEEMKAERFEERFGSNGDEETVTGEELETARREGRDETVRSLVESGMAQTEIADALDLHPSTVSKIVNREDE